MRNKFGWLLVALSLCSIALLGYLGKEIRTIRKTNKLYGRFFMNIEKGSAESTPWLGSVVIPSVLRDVPFADDDGLVLDTTRVSIRGIQAPWNGSMIEEGDGYLLFFRYDVIDSSCPGPYYTYVGCARLDASFQQTQEEFTRIDTGSQFSEDPRVVRVGKELYLVFNDLQSCGVHCRTMRIGRVNLAESKLDFVTNLDMQIKQIEKNWVPFEYIEDGRPSVYLEYYITPHKILKLEDPSVSEMVHLPSPGSATYQKLYWPPVWGELRGGAPPRKVEDQYLGFFHSFFNDFNGCVWYIMGAYTFEEKPPFRVSGISNYPILFKTIYDTPPSHTAAPHKRVIYPGSFLTGVRSGKEVIYLVCGENDCAIKVITLDKKALLKSLKKV